MASRSPVSRALRVEHRRSDRVLDDGVVAEQGDPAVAVARLHGGHGPLPRSRAVGRRAPPVRCRSAPGRHRSTWAMTVSANRRRLSSFACSGSVSGPTS